MADVKVCDRCHKILTGKMATVDCETKKSGVEKWWTVLLRALDEYYGGWREIENCNFDLCADCGKELLEFMDNEVWMEGKNEKNESNEGIQADQPGAETQARSYRYHY